MNHTSPQSMHAHNMVLHWQLLNSITSQMLVLNILLSITLQLNMLNAAREIL